ncbi:MAG TPA: response regulator, partial [Phototrophicaceae bacterium]|nr:response regulator [Phototrophicaceae bacterium]
MKKSKVMMIEDDPGISKLVNDYLTKHGYEVTTMPDGPDALEYIKQRGLPHIALIDLGLPTMHGFEVSSRIKAMADVPIIFVTAINDTDT